MSDKDLRDIARRLPKTRDIKYNEGKEHCANGIMYTKEAQYFMMCEPSLRRESDGITV